MDINKFLDFPVAVFLPQDDRKALLRRVYEDTMLLLKVDWNLEMFSDNAKKKHSVLDLMHLLDKLVYGKTKTKSDYLEAACIVLELIAKHDTDVNVYMKLYDYLMSTFDDKYCAGAFTSDTLIWGGNDNYCIGNAIKYIQRYHTEGFEKSRNLMDLYKAYHYILFSASAHYECDSKYFSTTDELFNMFEQYVEYSGVMVNGHGKIIKFIPHEDSMPYLETSKVPKTVSTLVRSTGLNSVRKIFKTTNLRTNILNAFDKDSRIKLAVFQVENCSYESCILYSLDGIHKLVL